MAKLLKRIALLLVGVIGFIISTSLFGEWGLLVGVILAYILYDYAME